MVLVVSFGWLGINVAHAATQAPAEGFGPLLG